MMITVHSYYSTAVRTSYVSGSEVTYNYTSVTPEIH